MSKQPAKHNQAPEAETQSRRAFLARCAQLGTAALAAGDILNPAAFGQSQLPANVPTTLPTPASMPTIGPIPASLKSIVATVRRLEVVERQKIHRHLLQEMIEDGITAITETRLPGEAWNSLLSTDDIIGIKFNHVGADEFATTDIMAQCLVDSLKDAGFPPERIVLIEVPHRLEEQLKTTSRVFGWTDDEFTFTSGSERLASVLNQVSAIINVPFLKTHNITGMTGSLKNLSHALIRRPGLYHANGCQPFIADIVSLPQIKSKIKVNIINGLRALYQGGPHVKLEGMWNHSGLIVSKDPVAADSVGLDILNAKRAEEKLPRIGSIMGRLGYLHDAAEKGLGTDDQDYIKLVDVDLG
jgi:hypothetical protein